MMLWDRYIFERRQMYESNYRLVWLALPFCLWRKQQVSGKQAHWGRYFIYDNYYVPYFYGSLVYPVLLSLCWLKHLILCYSLTLLPYYPVTCYLLHCYHVTCYPVTVLHVTVLPCYHVTMLPVTLLPRYLVTVLPCYRVTPLATARSRLSPTYSRPLAINAP